MTSVGQKLYRLHSLFKVGLCFVWLAALGVARHRELPSGNLPCEPKELLPVLACHLSDNSRDAFRSPASVYARVAGHKLSWLGWLLLFDSF